MALRRTAKKTFGEQAAARSSQTKRSLARRKAAAASPRKRAAKPLTFRFKPGDRVVTRKHRPQGHCRTPTYLRGKPGVIDRCLGHFRNPQQLAYGKTGLPKVPLYRVRYEIPRLWKRYEGARSDTLVADIYEFWLEPA